MVTLKSRKPNPELIIRKAEKYNIVYNAETPPPDANIIGGSRYLWQDERKGRLKVYLGSS